MTKLKKNCWMSMMAIVAFGLVGCGKGGNASLATINGDEMSIDQFHKYLENKRTVRIVTANGQVGNATVSESLGFQALQDLIQQKLVLQMAKDEGVYPADEELTKEVDFQKRLNPNFLKDYTSRGFTLNEIREQLRIELAREKILTKNIKVTDDDAKKYVKDNPKEFVDPAMADSYVIFVKTDADKAKVDAELARGQAFAQVAARLSQIPGAKSDQRYKERLIDRMEGPIKAAISKTAPSTQSEWVKLSDGFAKFYVTQKTQEKAIIMDVDKYERVRRALAVQRGLRNKDLDKTLLEKYKAAVIDVKYDALKEPFAEFQKKLKEETKDAK